MGERRQIEESHCYWAKFKGEWPWLYTFPLFYFSTLLALTPIIVECVINSMMIIEYLVVQVYIF